MTSFRARVQRLAGLLALTASLFATSAASTVLFEYRSTCEVDCANVGLAAGDAVSGLIGFTDDALALGVALSPDDVALFDLTIGTFNFDRASLDFAFAIFTGFEPNAFVFQFVSGAPGTEPGYNISYTDWFAGPSVTTAASGGFGTLTRVPEPSSVALVALALAAAAAMRRRRRRD
jgi:hypothetical protein